MPLRWAPFPPLPPLMFSLLTLTATTPGQEHGTGVRVVVKEGNDVFLPCSLATKENITAALFDWRKVAERDELPQEVFMYDAASHYNNGLHGQSPKFRERVSHFQEELKHGNASIVIRNSKMADAGNYSCAFPRLGTPKTYVELVVDVLFKDRSGEISVAAPEPSVRTLDAAETWSLLQCEVRGASPKPTVSWQNSDGNQLPAEKPQVSQTGSSSDITLNVTVTRTDRYRCVVEQQDIKHRVSSETFVLVSGKVCEDSSSKVAIGWCCGCLLGVVSVLAVGALLVFLKLITIRLNNSSRPEGTHQENKKEYSMSSKRSSNNGNDVEHAGNGGTYKKVNGSCEDSLKAEDILSGPHLLNLQRFKGSG